jgi:non-heme chloroperoxidase
VREQTATNRSQFFYDFTLPFFGYNREGAQIKEAIRLNWWRQGMNGGALAHYQGIAAFRKPTSRRISRPSPSPRW